MKNDMKEIRADALRWTFWPVVLMLCIYGVSHLTGAYVPPVLMGYPNMGIPYVGSWCWLIIVPLCGFAMRFFYCLLFEGLLANERVKYLCCGLAWGSCIGMTLFAIEILFPLTKVLQIALCVTISGLANILLPLLVTLSENNALKTIKVYAVATSLCCGLQLVTLFNNIEPRYGEFFLALPGTLPALLSFNATLISIIPLCFAVYEKIFCRKTYELIEQRFKAT